MEPAMEKKWLRELMRLKPAFFDESGETLRSVARRLDQRLHVLDRSWPGEGSNQFLIRAPSIVVSPDSGASH
jgi:hypothetical protein